MDRDKVIPITRIQGRIMVRVSSGLLRTTIFMSLTFGVSTSVLGAKRYIVHYQTQKSVSGSATIESASRAIIEADSEDEVKANFALGSDAIVEIEEDLILEHFMEPADAGEEDRYYSKQWHYFDSVGGIAMPEAWNVTIGDSEVVVAVVDTGILYHSDLSGRILPGADMVSDTLMSNDGDGRDNDPTDAGDWVDASDSCYSGSTSSSSWHGTHVAGTIAANSANDIGVAGINWGAKILPVRVLGKCGGYLSDIADGIRWAAGGSVTGVSDNPYPARVINLSLGGTGYCSSTMQDAINYARSQGAVVVVAAGNSGANMDYTSYVPASCEGVVTVGASNKYASKSYYSNYGADVDIMGPGGDYNGTVFSTHNDGDTYADTDSYTGMMGTSMAAPHIAGVASLMIDVNSELSPDQVESILKETATAISCTSTAGCGSGLVHAYRAVAEAEVVSGDGAYSDYSGLDSEVSSSDHQVLEASDDGGGMCGSVAFVNSDGSGPRGGLGAQLMSLLLGLMITLGLTQVQKKNQNELA